MLLSRGRTAIMDETPATVLGTGNVPGYVLSIKYTLEGVLMPTVGSIGFFGEYILYVFCFH